MLKSPLNKASLSLSSMGMVLKNPLLSHLSVPKRWHRVSRSALYHPCSSADASHTAGPPTLTTLQAFHAALPKPMPDHIGTKSNGEINAIAWVNTIVQVC